MSDEPVKGKRGRRSRDEELELYLAELGIDKGELEAVTRAPESFSEMKQLAAAHLWAEFESLKGTAKVQAFNAIRQLAKEEPDGQFEDEQEPTVAEVLAGIAGLKPEKRRQILEREQAAIERELDQIKEALLA